MAAGRVTVNGKVATTMGTLVDPAKDVIKVDGNVITAVVVLRYIAFNKPVGVTCTRAQFKSEKTVYDIVPDVRELVIAGRLDKDSGGLVLLTNDGELTNVLTHPRFGHEKEYLVTTTKPLNAEALAALRRGVRLEEGPARFDRLDQLSPLEYRVVMHQGWKRQIRRMFGTVRADVAKLTRIRIQKLKLGDLKPGTWREVQRTDIV